MKTTTNRMKKSATRKTTLTTYNRVSNNIYHDGTSYRVRAVVGGTKVSRNFSSKRQAIAYRNILLAK
jgi:methanogenic corrinoid protein MtbC1